MARWSKKKDGKDKRRYAKPRIEPVKVDNFISIHMLTPPDDPGGKIIPDQFMNDPFKLPNL